MVVYEQTNEFRDAIRDYLRSNPQMKEAVSGKMRDIMASPLMGYPKTGQLVGLRQLHFPRHYVMTWALTPILVNPDHLHKLQKLTWILFERHPE